MEKQEKLHQRDHFNTLYDCNKFCKRAIVITDHCAIIQVLTFIIIAVNCEVWNGFLGLNHVVSFSGYAKWPSSFGTHFVAKNLQYAFINNNSQKTFAVVPNQP